MTKWNKVVQSAWHHTDVNFEPKSWLLPLGFLDQITYGFEAQEVMNPMLQMDCNFWSWNERDMANWSNSILLWG